MAGSDLDLPALETELPGETHAPGLWVGSRSQGWPLVSYQQEDRDLSYNHREVSAVSTWHEQKAAPAPLTPQMRAQPGRHLELP